MFKQKKKKNQFMKSDLQLDVIIAAAVDRSVNINTPKKKKTAKNLLPSEDTVDNSSASIYVFVYCNFSLFFTFLFFLFFFCTI